MLVLSRKVGEQICVPDFDIVLTVLGVRGKRVRLGIIAPDEITVVREELWRRSQQPGERDALVPAVPCGNSARTASMNQ